MDKNALLFKLVTKDGHEYELYLNGELKGFPEGTSIINYASALWDQLEAQKLLAEGVT